MNEIIMVIASRIFCKIQWSSACTVTDKYKITKSTWKHYLINLRTRSYRVHEILRKRIYKQDEIQG